MVNALVNAFRNNGSNRVLQAKIISTLKAFSEGLPSSQEFLDSGGLGAFLEMLQIANKNRNSYIAKRVLDSLIDLFTSGTARSVEDCKTFGEAFLSHPKGLQTVNESAASFSDNEIVLAAVAKLLRMLCICTGKAETVFGSSVFKTIIQTLGKHPEMKELAFESVKLVSLAAGDIKMQDILSKAGALSSMAVIQNIHDDNPELMQLCDQVLEASGNAGFEHLTADEATDLLKQAQSSGDAGTLAKALSNIAKLAVLDGEARGLMIDELGTFKDVVGIVGDLDGPPFDEVLLGSAVLALEQVPVNANTANDLLESNCVEKLLGAMRQYPDNVELLLKCIRNVLYVTLDVIILIVIIIIVVCVSLLL